MGAKTSELIGVADAALNGGRWDDARALFATALKEKESPEALFGIGQAVWWLGDASASVGYQERAYVQFRRVGDLFGAAQAAMSLCVSYKSNFGNQSASSGWIARAERLFKNADPGPLQGWLWLIRGYDSVDPERSRVLARRALEFARRSPDPDLELCALADIGVALVAMGMVSEGMDLIDESMAGTLGGEPTRLDTVVFTSCSMLAACDLAADIERSSQWCRVADDFIRTYGCPFLFADCRTRYGSMFVATGRWAEAERELMVAIGMAKDVAPSMYARALAHLADLRLRQGRPDEAEELLLGLEDQLAAVLPAAALRLVHNEPAAAVALLQRRLASGGGGPMELAPVLGLLVEANLARGDLPAAMTTEGHLSALAQGEKAGTQVVMARTALASGQLANFRKEGGLAIPLLERAMELFGGLNLPLEAARARLELARTHISNSPQVAVAEARLALATFTRLGAAADADASAWLLRSLGVRARSGPRDVGALTHREQEVLQLVGIGLSNPEIAERLFISRKTAAHHVSSVLTKLDLRNRAQAAAYAVRMAEKRYDSHDSEAHK